jgi:Chaperone of endosialidase
MSFPANPINGQTTTTNNITYVYNSAGTGYWTRLAPSTSTTIATNLILNVANTSQSTSTTTGALTVGGGLGVVGNINFGGNLYQNGVLFAAGTDGLSSTGTTSSFTILSTVNSTSTNSGALQVRGGAGIGKNLYVGGDLTVGNTVTSNIYATTIYDIADTTFNTYLQPNDISKVVAISARGNAVAGTEAQIGTISVTRSAVSATNSATYFGLYNKATGWPTGIGVDYQNNFWVGKVTSGISSTRASNYFYSDTSGNVTAASSFRSNVYYATNNTAYFLDFANTSTTTRHAILSNGVSNDLIGFDPILGVYIGGTDNRYLTNGTTASGGPLWVMTGTSYNLIHSGNISQYAANITTTTFVNPVIIRLNTVDTTGTTASTHLTLINPSVGAASSGIYWRFANQSEIRASVRVNDSGDIIYNSLSGNYKFQSDFGTTGTSFLISATTFMSVDYAGNVSFPKNITASKLIDYDDNTYFLDPSSTSTINQLTMKGVFTATVAGTANTWTDVLLATANLGGTYISAKRPTVATGDVGYKWMTGTSTIWANYLPATDPYTLTWGLLGVKQFTMNSAGNMSTQVAGAAIGSPQFYDANNSGYYIKPSGYSYLNSLNLGGQIIGISTGTGMRVFTTASDTFNSTLLWGVPGSPIPYLWNWQTDTGGNAALWSSTTTRVLTVTQTGNWGFNQSSIPGDVTMIGGISVTGTGDTQMSAMKGSTSGFSLRVSDSVFGDFSLYDKAQGSWKLALNARQGSVGVNTTATTTYGLSVGGDININGNIYQNGAALNSSVSTGTFSANQYAWYQNTGTGIGFTQNNTFETAAIFGGDHVLGSGSLYDLLAWNYPNPNTGPATEYYNGVSSTWVTDAADVRSLFNGQNSLMSVSANYTFTGIGKQGVRFTWSTFNNRYWDALLITANSGGVPLDVTIESSNDGTSWTTYVNRASIGLTSVNGIHYLRNQANTAIVGPWFRLTIRETTASITAVNLYNISLLGTKGAANRLLNWDNQRNITTYGNLITNIVYDTNNLTYYLSPSKTSNLFTATLAGDLLTQGQGRFTGWRDTTGSATRYAGLGLEVGVASGVSTISSYDRTASAYSNLSIFGSPIKILPQTTASVYIGGTWYDNDDARFYVKPSIGSVVTNIKAYGLVEVVNTGGTSYNENIRLPRAADGYSMIAMAVSSTASSGSIFGQWNLAVAPNTGGANQGEFRILNSSTTAFSIATATSTATFAANVFAPKYLQVGADQTFFIQQGQTSYLNALNVGPIGASFDVLTRGPLDEATYPNTYTYVHSVLSAPDTTRDFNETTSNSMSFVGSFAASANSPLGNGVWYTLYQARHRGGYGDGPNYGSQIAIPMAGLGNSDYTRMFFRSQPGAWRAWSEVFTVGANNQAQGYTIYAKTLYDYSDTRYNITPGGTSTLYNLNTYGTIQGYLSGTPTASPSGSGATLVPALPRLGSSEWVYPNTQIVGLSVGNATTPGGDRNVYRAGLYTWKVTSGDATPTGSTNPYFAGVGFGSGAAGSAEISAYIVPGGSSNDQGVGLYFRTLRDTTSPWTKWTKILNDVEHTYAANLNQNLRTSDSPTFNSLTLNGTPTFAQVIAQSYWITGGAKNKAKIVIPWDSPFTGGGAGAIGTYYVPAGPPITLSPTDTASFRFDEVSKTAVGTGEMNYLGNTGISVYIGPNKVIGNSGSDAWHTNIYCLADTSYRLIANGLSQISALEAKNGITLTGDNSSGKSAKLSLTSGRGLIDASFANSRDQQLARGTVATFGAGLGGWDGYVIAGTNTVGGTAGTYDVSFVKRTSASDWGIKSGSNGVSPYNNEHWAIYVNGGDNVGGNSQRMSLNATSPGLVNGSYALSINGTVYSNNNIYAFSDRRKKTKIVTIDNALEKVMKLRGVYYYRTDAEPEDVDRRDLGVIAQEVLEVLPEAVKHSSHTDEYSVTYGNMAGIFIEAIKDLKKELDELKAELNMLKGNK